MSESQRGKKAWQTLMFLGQLPIECYGSGVERGTPRGQVARLWVVKRFGARGVTMDLGPISGIPVVVLSNAQRAKEEGDRQFEIGASERSGDDKPKEQSPQQQRAKAEEEFHPTADTAPPDNPPIESEIDAEGQHNWFV